MYSQKSWGGSTPPFILFTAMKSLPEDGSDPIVSLVIFEWKDEHLFGAYPTRQSTEVSNNQMPSGDPVTDALGHNRRSSVATMRMYKLASAPRKSLDHSSSAPMQRPRLATRLFPVQSTCGILHQSTIPSKRQGTTVSAHMATVCKNTKLL